LLSPLQQNRLRIFSVEREPEDNDVVQEAEEEHGHSALRAKLKSAMHATRFISRNNRSTGTESEATPETAFAGVAEDDKEPVRWCSRDYCVSFAVPEKIFYR
jgi:hypothetical protein